MSFIEPKIVELGAKLSYNAGQHLRKILLDGGVTDDEIKGIFKKMRRDVSINGVPLDAVLCEHCQGRGWNHEEE